MITVRPGRSQRRGCRVALAVVVAVVIATSLGQGLNLGQLRSTPPSGEVAIAELPEQKPSGTAPVTKLPASLVRTTALLFEQGIPDPRECEYREVDLGEDPPGTTHQFVMPARAGDAGRFAVGWDGAVWPVLRVGAAVRLDDDVRALADALRTRRKEAAARQPARPGAAPGPDDLADATGFSGGGVQVGTTAQGPMWIFPVPRLEVCLMLRLGRADLAELLFAAGTGWTPADPPRNRAGPPILYDRIAREWAERVYLLAVDAHEWGDDVLCLDGIRRLAAFTAAAGRTLAALRAKKTEQEQEWEKRGYVSGAPLYFPNLTQLHELLADQERRAREPRRGPVPGPDAPAAARVEALIAALDQVRGRGGFNGITSPTGSETEQALVREGDAAVEPLLAALETDDRLTRAVSQAGARSSIDDRYIHLVYEAEHAALLGIMKTHNIPGATGRTWRLDRAARKREAAAIRAYWEKVRGVPELERYYNTLLDDAATPTQWLEAAEALAQPGDIWRGVASYRIPYRVGGKVPPPRGEPLRGQKEPSVTALIARRVESIDRGAPARSLLQAFGAEVPLLRANRMAEYLAEWDLKGALPTLKGRVDQSVAVFKTAAVRRVDHHELGAGIARLTLLRVRGGDPGALDDYAAWVRTSTPHPPGQEWLDVAMFEPMWTNPDHPAIAVAAAALFDDPASPWLPLVRPDDRGWMLTKENELVVSRLLGVEPFRRQVLAGLADAREEGTIAALYCYTLEGLVGTPRCELFWPRPKRDAAIAACAAFLRQYGARFRYTEAAKARDESASFDPRHARAILTFDPLDHPAAPEDVRAGRAIFSLVAGAGGQGRGRQVRRWPMPAFPMKGRWTTLELANDDPGLQGIDVRSGPPTAQIEMLKEGMVWQAEEEKVGNQWRRYYGFAGRYSLERVPAEELEFPAPWSVGWYPVSAGLDGRIVPPGGFDDGFRIVSREVALGSALPVELWLRNGRGVDSQVPAGWARVEGGLSLRDGVTLRLFRVLPRAEGMGRLIAASPPREEEVVGRELRRHHDEEAPRLLAPTGTACMLRLDLRDVFPVETTGRYRVEVTSEALTTAEGKPARLSEYFVLVKADGKRVAPPGR